MTQLKIKIFADGADLETIKELALNPLVSGFTTNPTLMRKSGVTNYEKFARDFLELVPNLPVSFEVFADEAEEMIDQARIIASWGENVYVKIPVMNTKGVFMGRVLKELSNEGISLNVTAILTIEQVKDVSNALNRDVPSIISVFAGRVADTGRDPVPLMIESIKIAKSNPKAELLWASPRELLNVVQANEIGCRIITITEDLMKKLPLIGKNLMEYSKETVEMFYQDAVKSQFTIGKCENLEKVA